MDNLVKLYSVFDRVCERFGPLFEAMNDAVAVRNFRIMLNKVDNTAKNDYKLYVLAVYDQKSGEIVPEHPHEVLTAAVDEKIRDIAELRESNY